MMFLISSIFSLPRFSPALRLTPIDHTVLTSSDVWGSLAACVGDITHASSHTHVISALDKMAAYVCGVRVRTVGQFFSTQDWYTPLGK